MKRLTFLFLAAIWALSSCQSGEEFKKSPVDNIIRDMPADVESYSIILFDMDVEGSFVRTFKHQYKIVKVVKGTPSEETTGWFEVSKPFFRLNENNMGMEIAAKSKDGKITKNAAPAGYSNYVGNTQYGQWVNNGSGNMVWQFFAQYAMMSMMFNMMRQPAYHSNWNTFHSGYYGRSNYYGPSTQDGTPTYGSQSSFARKTSSNSRWRRSSSFNSSSSSGSRRGSFWSSSRTSRSGSRWGSGSGSSGWGGSSFRSRSRGFGK